MIKLVLPGSFGFDEPIARRVKISSSGLGPNDRRDFLKRASHDFLGQLSGLREGEVPIHIIAMGTTSRYGCNRNGDGFSDYWLARNHNTFVKDAHQFNNHDNKTDSLRYGRLLASAFNDPMHRIELLLGTFETEQAAERGHAKLGRVDTALMEKLARGEDPAFSMACSTSPETPVLTATGYKRIADIAIGDLVHTQAGRWRPVTELRRREYTGDVLRILLEGLPVPLELTADHPMYSKILQDYPAAFRGQRTVGQWKAEVEQDGAQPFDWNHATHLGVDDRIECLPVTVSPPGAVLDDTRLCALMGIYTAEGSVLRAAGNPVGVVLTIHADDWAVAGVPAIIAELWPDVVCKLRPKNNCKVAFSLETYSADLARFMIKFIGSGFAKKRIPLELFGATNDCKLAFLGRWLDGDGWGDSKGIHWSSGNLGLILQGRDLLLSLGLPSSIYKIDHSKCKTSGYSNSGCEYTLNLSKFDAETLIPWSAKAAACEHIVVGDAGKKQAAGLYPIGDSFAYRIKSVERSAVESCPTWNIEVADDHSYGLAGMTSHNCRIAHDVCSHCQNKAAHRNEYCDATTIKLASGRTIPACSGFGCRSGLTKVGSDGRIQHVDNPDPRFFDISHVPRPADRIAFALGRLEKAAGAVVMGGAEMAERMGLSPASPVSSSSSKVARAMIELNTIVMLEREADHQVLWRYKLASAVVTPPYRLADAPEQRTVAFRALADAGVVLDLTNWLTLNTGKQAADVIADVAACLPGAAEKLAAAEDIVEQLSTNPYQAADRESTFPWAKWAHDLVATHSTREDRMTERAMRSALRGLDSSPPLTKSASAPYPAAQALAEQYTLYRVAFLSDQPVDSPSLQSARKLVAMQLTV